MSVLDVGFKIACCRRLVITNRADMFLGAMDGLFMISKLSLFCGFEVTFRAGKLQSFVIPVYMFF